MATKALSEASKIAIEKVLAKQTGVKDWTTKAHCAAIAFLSEAIYGAEANDTEEKANKAFRDELQAEPWTYASNMKKRIVEAGLISESNVTDEYK